MANDPTILICDLETTGAKIESAGICQMAAVAVINGQIIQPLFQTYCKPCEPMGAEAEKVHGITPEYYEFAPTDGTATWVLWALIKQFGQNVVLSGFNSDRFDYPLLQKVWSGFNHESFQHLDYMPIAVREARGASYKLGDTYRRKFGEDRLATQAHDAMADCLMVARLLTATLLEKNMSVGQLISWIRTPQVLPVMPHGKHRGLAFKDVPASYLTWAADAWTDMSDDMAYTLKSLGIDTVR